MSTFNWFHFSVVGNIILGAVIIILGIDRASFHRICKIRHNPIDVAILEIKEKLTHLYDLLVEHINKGES